MSDQSNPDLDAAVKRVNELDDADLSLLVARSVEDAAEGESLPDPVEGRPLHTA